MSNLVKISDGSITAVGMITKSDVGFDHEVDGPLVSYEGVFVCIHNGYLSNTVLTSLDVGLPCTFEAVSPEVQAKFEEITKNYNLEQFITSHFRAFQVNELTARMSEELVEFILVNPQRCEQIKEVILRSVSETIDQMYGDHIKSNVNETSFSKIIDELLGDIITQMNKR